MHVSEFVDDSSEDDIPPIWETFKSHVRERPDNLAVACLHQPAHMYGFTSQPLDNKSEYLQKPWLRWTYHTLGEAISRLAGAFASRGMQEDAPFFTFLLNGVESTLCLWASHAAGYQYVPFHPNNLTNQVEISHMINVVLEHSGHKQPIVVAGSIAVAEQIDSLGLLQDALKTVVSTESRKGWIAFQELMQSNTRNRFDLRTVLPPKAGSEKMVLFTSGSTALPKGCAWEYPRGAAALERRMKTSGHATSSSKVLVPMPNNHGAAYICVLPWIYRGGATVFHGLAFDPEAIIKAMYLEDCTDVLTVPTMIHALALAKESLGLKLNNIGVFVAGSPLTTEHVRECIEVLGARGIANCWGMTENIHTTTGLFTDLNQFAEGVDISVGKCPSATRIKVCEPDGQRPVPLGVPGEFHVSTSTLIPEYWGAAKDRDSDFYSDENGVRWFRTGDQAVFNEKGHVFIVGRHKEVIIKGGENISPLAIETTLARDPMLVEWGIQIVGAPDSIAGQVPVAVVKGRPGSDTFNQIRATVHREMGATFVPSELLTLEQLGLDDWPKTLIGKLQRNKVAKQVAAYFAQREAANKIKEKESGARPLPEHVKEIWASTIGVSLDQLPLDAEFKTFCDSITLMRVRARVTRETRRTLSLAEMGQVGTISKQIELLLTKKVRSSLSQETPSLSVTPTLDQLNPTEKTSISENLMGIGFSWEDVADVIPVSDLDEILSRSDQFNGWSVSQVLVTKNMSSEVLEQKLKDMVRFHPLIISCNIRTAADKSFHVPLKQTQKTLSRMIHRSGSLETKMDLEAIPKAYAAPRGPSAIPGPVLHAEIFDIKETGSAGLVMTLNHIVIDAVYFDMVLNDLEAVLAGSEPNEHVPYRVWNRSYQDRRNTPEAIAALEWQVRRMKEVAAHPEAIWPSPQKTTEHHIHYPRTFECAGLHHLRRKHTGVAAPTVFKAAMALAMVRMTRSLHATFTSCHSGRITLPFTPESESHLLANESSDVAGPLYTHTFDLIEVRPTETVLEFLHRAQELHDGVSKYATAPWHDVFGRLSQEEAERMQRLLFSSCFNWLPGMVGTGQESRKHMELLDTYFSSFGGLEVECSVGGAQQDQATIYLYGNGLSLGGMRAFAEGMETALKCLCASENWARDINAVWLS